MKYLSWLAASLAICVALAAPVRADVTPCPGIGGATGMVTCPTTRSCTDDAQCFGMGLGRCVRGNGGSSGVCSPNCNPIFRCSSESDCPTFDPLVATCRTTSISGVPGICEYHDPSDRPFVTLCGSGTATLAQFRACFSPAGHWADGDCDGDGTPNGVDAAPCSSSNAATVPAVASPFCLGGQICEGTSNVCTPFIRCTNGSTECDAVAASISTSGWECSALPAAPTTYFCHPSCNATAHCSDTVTCGVLGACRMVDATLSMCVPSALASCASTCSPLDWATGQGDCDGDGAQNGCDTSPCTVGAATCLYNHICTIDAGVSTSDAGIPVGDAFVSLDAGADASSQGDASTESDAAEPDASEQPDGSATDDAGTRDGGRTMDGGGSAIDASPGVDAAGQGFNGGGGCRCTIVGANVPASRGAWLVVMLALVMRHRARRR